MDFVTKVLLSNSRTAMRDDEGPNKIECCVDREATDERGVVMVERIRFGN